MLRRILLGLGIVGAAALIAALSMTWVTVSVVVHDDGLRLWIPAPVLLAQAVVAAVDPPALRMDIPVEPERLRAAAAVLRELEGAGDAELVRVESGAETVVVRTRDGRIEIEMESSAERVRIRVPIGEIRELLEEQGPGGLKPAALFQLARRLPPGPLVEFSEPGTAVAVRVW